MFHLLARGVAGKPATSLGGSAMSGLLRVLAAFETPPDLGCVRRKKGAVAATETDGHGAGHRPQNHELSEIIKTHSLNGECAKALQNLVSKLDSQGHGHHDDVPPMPILSVPRLRRNWGEPEPELHPTHCSQSTVTCCTQLKECLKHVCGSSCVLRSCRESARG